MPPTAALFSIRLMFTQLFQLLLEGGAVRGTVPGGLPRQLGHAVQTVLDLRQHGLPRLQTAAGALQSAGLAHPVHQQPQGV